MPYYSKEDIERANEYSLVDLLRYAGYVLVKEGKDYSLKEHDSLKISEHNGWKWFSRDLGGKNIDFFMQYENLKFIDAVDRIFSVMNDRKVMTELEYSSSADSKEVSSGEFTLPERNGDNKRVYAYLTKTRGLDQNLVKNLLQSGYVYEAKNSHNVVFVGKDYEGNIVSSFERGSTDKRFTRDTYGSDKNYRFRIVSQDASKVNVFEAEIDMLSYICINGLKNENYVALGGVSPNALNAFLEHNKQITNVNLCLDNDVVGDKAADKLKRALEDKYIVTREKSFNKDYNEDLIKNKEMVM